MHDILGQAWVTAHEQHVAVARTWLSSECARQNIAQSQATEQHKVNTCITTCTTQVKIQCTVWLAEEVKLHTAYAHWSITYNVLCTKCRLSWHVQMKAISLPSLTCASPLLSAMALKGPVHMMSDLNTGTVSQATLPITASTDETFFGTCSSPSIKEVEWSCMV